MPNEDLVEMAAHAGLDFILIDCEHGPAEVLALRQHLALAQLHGCGVLVRIGLREVTLAQRALDQGADGIVAPHIDDVDSARELVDALRYPPEGSRGFATYPRAGGFGTLTAAEHRSAARARTLIFSMLESPTATRNAEAIVACPGVDGYLIGPADLQSSSGDEDPSLDEAVRLIRAAGRQTGSLRMDLVKDAGAARAALADGAQLVVYNLTHVLMQVLSTLPVSTASR